MLGIGQDGFAANRLDGRNNRRFRCRDNDAAERRFCARRQTWTIIGAPAISARTLSGNRVEPMRAGIKITGFEGISFNTVFSYRVSMRHYAARWAAAEILDLIMVRIG